MSNVRVFWIAWCAMWALGWLLIGFLTFGLGWLMVPVSLLAILIPVGRTAEPPVVHGGYGGYGYGGYAPGPGGYPPPGPQTGYGPAGYDSRSSPPAGLPAPGTPYGQPAPGAPYGQPGYPPLPPGRWPGAGQGS